MNYAEIKHVWPGERSEEALELGNPHLAAMLLWDAIGKKWAPAVNFMFEPAQFWPLWKDERLPLHQRATLGMTYDGAYLLSTDYARAASDIRRTIEDLGISGHWPTIAQFLENGPASPAVGFYWTSVSEDPYKGVWDEDTDEQGPPDWSKFWSLYEGLEDADRT